MRDLQSVEYGRIWTFGLEHGKEDVKHCMGDMTERAGVMLSTRLLTFVDGREERIAHIAWSHWRRVLSEPCPLHGKATALVRFGLRFVLPAFLYRRLVVMNYNALCESTFSAHGNARGPGER